ncbi:MAG: PLD nuclease N-terminal domain-containing protein [Phycisphaeraceae bacterium]
MTTYLALAQNLTVEAHPVELFAFLPCCIPLIVVPVGLLAMAFWIWMLVDCLTKMPSEGNDKVIWVLVIVLTHWVGALIYFFVVKQPRDSAT